MTKKELSDSEARIQARLDIYRQDFDIDSLNQSNDKAMLMTLIRCEIILENVQAEIENITGGDSDFLGEADRLKKLFDLQRDMIAQITKAQQTLSIDRKTRKSEQTTSVAEYIRDLKAEAYKYADKRLIKIYCPDCKVMVARYAPVHDHTAFHISTECSQCGKAVRAHREARDIWFDVKDADWRRAYKAEIVQPKLRQGFTVRGETAPPEAELIIEAEYVSRDPVITEDQALPPPEPTQLEDAVIERPALIFCPACELETDAQREHCSHCGSSLTQ